MAAQKRANQRGAKTRARVEHVFAHMDLFRSGKLLRCTGLQRATVAVGLINFVHNLRRLATMHRKALAQAGGETIGNLRPQDGHRSTKQRERGLRGSRALASTTAHDISDDRSTHTSPEQRQIGLFKLLNEQNPGDG